MGIKRYKYIDYTKGIGILLIMFAHVSQYFKPMSTVNSFVTSLHVPIFFIASGLLMGYRENTKIDKKDFLVKRVKSLLIPYAIFSLFNSALKFAVLSARHLLTEDAVKSELVQLCITGNGTVWFLFTLFLTEIIYVFCLRDEKIARGHTKYTIQAMYMISCLTAPYLIGEIKNPFAIVGNRVIAAMGYYILGILLIRWKGREVSHSTVRAKLLLSLILTVIGTIAWKFLGNTGSFFGGTFTNMSGVVTAVLLALACIAWLKCLEDLSAFGRVKRFLDYYGTNSLVVMLVHPTLLLLATYPLGGTFFAMQGVLAVAVSLILYVALAAAEIPFIWFINKYIPFAIGKNNNRN